MHFPALNIVIADEDSDEIEFFEAAMEDVSCNAIITSARDGEELLELLDELPIPDAIILELRLAKMNGLECLERIRANSNFVDVPIIILTSCDSWNKNHCLENGANLYIEKVCTQSNMKMIAKQICDARSLVNSTVI
jgi:CheY-like chemotaxis protein